MLCGLGLLHSLKGYCLAVLLVAEQGVRLVATFRVQKRETYKSFKDTSIVLLVNSKIYQFVEKQDKPLATLVIIRRK